MFKSLYETLHFYVEKCRVFHAKVQTFINQYLGKSGAPYIRKGENDVEVLVYSTLSNHN